MNRNRLPKNLLGLFLLLLLMPCAKAQITGKYGTYYDQRELLFESLPTSESDIIFLGNSITDGGEWCELFENPNCKNRGISGDITDGVLNRLETITKGQPAMVFLMIGTNDMNWGRSNDTIAMNVREIVQRIKKESPRTKIIVQSILPTNDCYGLFTGHTKRWQDVAIINGMLKTMSEEEGVTYLDLYSRFATEEGKMNPEYSNDGLHINGEGYKLWKAAVEEEIGCLPQPSHKHKTSIWLFGGLGEGWWDSYDNGTVPYPNDGLGVGLSYGGIIEWRRCHVQVENRWIGGVFDKVLGYGIGIDMRAEFLYRCYDGKRNRFHLWAGGGVQSYMDLKIIPSMNNASTGTSIFENVCAGSMAQYDFAFINGGTHNLLSIYGKLTLPLVGIVGRPSFSYMDNYTSNLYLVSTILSGYEMFPMAFPGVCTDIGIRFNLPNGNKIGLSYRWDYLTTRNKAIYRSDNALHTLNVNLMFNLH
jgi:lysophospholipase L1-like esterase